MHDVFSDLPADFEETNEISIEIFVKGHGRLSQVLPMDIVRLI